MTKEIDFELHSAPGALGTKIEGDISPAQAEILKAEGAVFDEEWGAWWLAGDASRDPNGGTRRERAEKLVARLEQSK
jgi:hypothetical protein